jgi:hypothetical protein
MEASKISGFSGWERAMKTFKQTLAVALLGSSLLFAQLPNPLGLPDPLHLSDGSGLPNPLNLPDPLGLSRPAQPKAGAKRLRRPQPKYVHRRPRRFLKHHG